MKILVQLAALFRFLQLYAHAAHNLCKGESFFADHGYLGELYGTYEGIYDGLVERLLGLGANPSIPEITDAAAQMFAAAGVTEDQDAAFAVLNANEDKARKLVELAFSDRALGQGTLNLLADLADKSEARSYQLGRRTI